MYIVTTQAIPSQIAPSLAAIWVESNDTVEALDRAISAPQFTIREPQPMPGFNVVFRLLYDPGQKSNG
jgi:hypothetical protein